MWDNLGKFRYRKNSHLTQPIMLVFTKFGRRSRLLLYSYKFLIDIYLLFLILIRNTIVTSTATT